VGQEKENRTGHSVEPIEGDLAVGCGVLERGENANCRRWLKSGSRCRSQCWRSDHRYSGCVRIIQGLKIRWDHLAQFGVIDIDVENQTHSAFRYHDDGGHGQ